MEKVIKDLEEVYEYIREEGKGTGSRKLRMMDQVANAIITLKERRQIVNCIDCRHADISPSGLIKCQGRFRSREWFCADGERRSE